MSGACEIKSISTPRMAVGKLHCNRLCVFLTQSHITWHVAAIKVESFTCRWLIIFTARLQLYSMLALMVTNARTTVRLSLWGGVRLPVASAHTLCLCADDSSLMVLATRNGHAKTLEELLMRNFDVEETNIFGGTPMSAALTRE